MSINGFDNNYVYSHLNSTLHNTIINHKRRTPPLTMQS